MDIKLTILCKNYRHKRVINNKIIVDRPEGEYYLIPITREWSLDDSHSEYYELKFMNQQLWLKYSNRFNEIVDLKDYGYTDYIVIESEQMENIQMSIHTSECFCKNVWQSNIRVGINKKYTGKHLLIIPIFENLMDVTKTGEGIPDYYIRMMSNEIILREAKARSKYNTEVNITNNFLLNKEALFIPLTEQSLRKFLPE